MGLKGIERQTPKEAAAMSLRKAIFDGVLRRGQRIRAAEVASRLGLGRASVRAALELLEQEGRVERSGNRGMVVASLSRKDVEEICCLRSMYEVQAIRQAIRNATAEHLAKLEKTINALEATESPGEAIELDLQFHEILMRATNNQRLMCAWLSLRPELSMFLLEKNLLDIEFSAHTAEGHRGLLEAIRARDEGRAVSLMEQHVAVIYQWIPDRFQQTATADRAVRSGTRRQRRPRKLQA